MVCGFAYRTIINIINLKFFVIFVDNLVRAIHSLCKGEVSPEVEQFMASLSHDEIDGATKLFARNHDVEIVNSQELLTLEGKLV